MMQLPRKPRVLFGGSFQEYSVIILEALLQNIDITICGVLTTPPKPAGRKKVLRPTAVQIAAEKASIPCFSPEELDFESLNAMTEQLQQPPDFFIIAGYGKLLPAEWLTYPKQAAINVHFSLLPSYRGANPAEWALLYNETETGVSIITMSPQFDTGAIVAQKKLSIEPTDTRETLYTKLYTLGAAIAPSVITQPLNLQPQPQTSPTPYAKRLTKSDAFIAWHVLKNLQSPQESTTKTKKQLLLSTTDLSPILQKIHLDKNHYQAESLARFIARACRALLGFPNLWTIVPTVKGEKRMKILSCEVKKLTTYQEHLLLNSVHIEGQQPAQWNQIKNQILDED